MNKKHLLLATSMAIATQLPQLGCAMTAPYPSKEVTFEQEATETAKSSSPTEGVITADFVPEAEMMSDLLQMLANSMQYAKGIWYDCLEPTTNRETCGFFKGNSAGHSNEDGVRTNADFSMISAFLYRYAKDKVNLPAGMTWDEVKKMAIKSLVFGYSTHKANQFKKTSNSAYWGSVSAKDHVWESSLWAMSLAYASYFLADELTAPQKGYIYQMIKAECNYELERNIPTGYKSDSKAEENGWEVNILASALGLYPNDELAPQWFDRMRAFAINSYSQEDDANNHTVIDLKRDNKTVADYYKGANLYKDFTLENHDYFHTSYQNVVIQELGESILALQLFQGDRPKWKSNALMHNNQQVMNKVLKELALADGELAMPNGNDWSMFLYDQIASYATMACFARDADALMLENLAYKYIKARQTTTADGSWLLNSDIGPRRMGVQGHRVMMTWLMHHMASTKNLIPTKWADFCQTYSQAKLFETQNIVRASNEHRFVCFSWSAGLKSYTGYIAANSVDKNKIWVPYKANNTGNFLGWYTVEGKRTNATPVVSGKYQLNGTSFVMNGVLDTNDKSLRNSFVLYATPGNAVVYLDQVKTLSEVNITGEQGGFVAVSTDPFTKEVRSLHYANGQEESDGKTTTQFTSNWVNIDNELGVVTRNRNGVIGFGNNRLTSSIHTAKLYTSYSTAPRRFGANELVDRRQMVYYSNIDAAETSRMSDQLQPLTDQLPETWNGAIVPDSDEKKYLILSNFGDTGTIELPHITTPHGAPVLSEPTYIEGNQSSVTITCERDQSFTNTLHFYLESEGKVAAVQAEENAKSIYLKASEKCKVKITAIEANKLISTTIKLSAGKMMCVTLSNGTLNAKSIK